MQRVNKEGITRAQALAANDGASSWNATIYESHSLSFTPNFDTWMIFTQLQIGTPLQKF